MTKLVEINGQAATVDTLQHPAVRNYGHFTTMQVRGAAVRGWSSHLRRLTESSRELFGQAVDVDRVREYTRAALRKAPDEISARINIFSRVEGELDVMVSVLDPGSESPSNPLRVRSVAYERELAHIKHVGFFGVLRQLKLAKEAGFDDALFVDRDGHISEGSLWNIAFWDGSQVVWPQAAMLPGITAELLRNGLEQAGVPSVTKPLRIEDLGAFRSAFAVNSTKPGQPIGSIDDVVFRGDDRGEKSLREAWATQPFEPV